MGRVKRTLGAWLVVLGGAALGPVSAAQATPGWTAAGSDPLPPIAAGSPTQLGYASGGVATVAFLQTTSGSPFQAVLHAGTRAPGDGYDEQFSVGSPSAGPPTAFRLAVAPDGAAVLEWSTLEGTNATTSPLAVQASFRPAGSTTWTAPTTVAAGIAQVSGQPLQLVAAVSQQAGAAAVEIPQSGGGAQLEIATASATGAWSGAVELGASATTSAANVALGYDSAGDLTAAYDSATPGGGYTLGDQRRPAGGTWGGFEDITGSDPAASAGAPELGVSPDGSAVLAFAYTDPAGSSPQAEAITRSGPAGPWSPPDPVAPQTAGQPTDPLAAGISPADEAYVLLTSPGAGGGTCAGVTRAAVSGAFTQPACLSAADMNPPLTGAVAFIGNDAYFAWAAASGTASADPVEAGSWPAAAGAPSAATQLAPAAADQTLTQILPDVDGGVVVLWTNAAAALQVAAFDAGGPNLVGADVPSRLPADQTAIFDATFADLWTGISAVAWNFGNGVGEFGAQVSHAYARPGTYTVSVTAADGLRNTTSRSFTVLVGPPAPRLSRVGVSPASWRQTAATTIQFGLSEGAAVMLTFTELSPHRRAAGTLTLAGRAGRNRLRFTGRISPTATLSPGRYAVTLVATLDQEPSATKRLTFTIVKAR